MAYPDDMNTRDRAGPEDAYTDESGAVVDGSPSTLGSRLRGVFSNLRPQPDQQVFGGLLNADSAAAYGPDAQGGRTISAPYAPRNAVVDASALAPRAPDGSDQVSRGLANGRLAASALPSGGPLASALAATPAGPLPDTITRSGNSFSGVGTAVNTPADPSRVATESAALDARNARRDADAQENRNATIAGLQRSAAQQDLTRIQGEQRVARFNLNNSADVLLGDQAGKDRAAAGINRELTELGGDAAVQQGRIASANAAAPGTRNYIDEFAKAEEAKTIAPRAQAAAGLVNVETQGKKLGLEQQKQMNAIVSQLGNPNLDPKQRAQLQESLLVMHGKDPNRFQIEHSNGPPVPDSFGGLHPGAQYVHIVDRWGKEPPKTLRADDTGQAKGATGAKPDLTTFLKQAKAANPDKSVDELTTFYKQKYGQ